MCYNGKLFPEKLYDLLDFAESQGMDHIISWCHDGLGFTVHDPYLLAESLLQLFFGTSKFRSFTRQLNHWCFYRVSTPSSARNTSGTFKHPFFIRGNKDICENLTRESFKRAPMTTACSAIVGCKTTQRRSISSHTRRGIKRISSPTTHYFCVDSPCYIQSSPFDDGVSSKVPELKDAMDNSSSGNINVEQMRKGNHEALRDGDPVEFEGKFFCFLDSGS